MLKTDTIHTAFVNLLTLNELYAKGFYSDTEYVQAINSILDEWRSHVPQNI